jgi:bacterioferritin
VPLSAERAAVGGALARQAGHGGRIEGVTLRAVPPLAGALVPALLGGRFSHGRFPTNRPAAGQLPEPSPVFRCLHRVAAPRPMNNPYKISREEMIKLLNEDLAREYQAVIAYVVYSQTMKGAKFKAIADELKKHAGEELEHAIQIAKQIDYLNGTPVTVPRPVRMSDKAEDMLQFDLDNEAETIKAYRERIRQAEAMGEFGLSEVLREIIAEEQEHLTDLADALGIDNPKISE